MNETLSIIGSFLIVTWFAGLFCLIGRMALHKIGRDGEKACYIFAASYFIGMAIYLAALRTLTMVIRSYRIVFWAMLLLSGVMAVIAIGKRYFMWVRQNSKLIAGMLCLWLACTVHAMLYRLIDVDQAGLTYNDSIGTIGSLRYAGIGAYFVEQNRIPVLNQSYGQSVLASFSGMFGKENLCFSLTLWLAVSGAFLCLLLYGVFCRYFQAGLSVLLTCVVYMGSVSLTLAPIRVVDSDYPLISNGYTDSVVGVATLFLYLEILIEILKQSRKLNFYHYLVSVCCVLYWSMSASHNIIVLFGVGAFLIVYLLVKKDYQNAGRGVLLGGVILAACLFGIMEGGMLTPSGFAEEVSVEGVMTVAGPDEDNPNEGIVIVPVMNYQFSKAPGVLWDLAQGTPYIKETLDCAVDALHNREWYVLLYALTSLWWDSVHIIFWPLLGVLGVGLAAYHQRDNRETAFWAMAGFGTLAVGYPIAFFISLNAYKWALSRFAMPFYFLGMLFLAVILGGALRGEKKLYRLISVGSVFIILIGQVLDKILILYGNCTSYDVWALMKKMALLANS